MNVKQLVKSLQFSHPEVEKLLDELAHTLRAYVQVQGKQDGKKHEHIPLPSYLSKITHYTGSVTQEVITQIKQILLFASNFMSTKEIESAGEKESRRLQKDRDDNEHVIEDLKMKKEQLDPNFSRMKWWFLFLVIFIVIGLADGATAFSSFYNGGYALWNALAAALIITIAIAGSHHYIVPWVRNSTAKQTKYLKIGIVLGCGTGLFYFLSHVRADAINNQIAVTSGSAYDALLLPIHVSPTAITVISVAAFAAILFLALEVWPDANDWKEFRMYNKIEKQIMALVQENEELLKKIKTIEDDTITQKNYVRVLHDYGSHSIIRAKHIRRAAITLYQKTYAQFHDMVPEFFHVDDTYVFDESFFYNHPTQNV